MTDTNPPRRPIWKRVMIGVSFGLNVLVISAVAGILLSGDRRGENRPPPLRHGSVAPMIGVLPPEARHDILSEMRKFGRENGISHKALDETRSQTIAVITAEPFDPQAVVTLLDESQDRFSVYGSKSNRLLAEQLSRMTPDERLAYADRLSRVQRVRGDRGEEKRPPKRP